MVQIFDNDYSSLQKKQKMTPYGIGLLLAGIYSMSMTPMVWTACPALCVPTAYLMIKNTVFKKKLQMHIQKLWLMENGQQLIAMTADGVLHKLNIIDMESYEIVTAKDGTISFAIVNAGSEYVITTKGVSAFDFNLIDRIVRAICVETKRATNVFHHQIHKQ